MEGLVSRGVTLPPATGYYISRNRGQGMMNKAAGEIAPTWHLMKDGLMRFGQLVSSGNTPLVRYEGREYRGVGSYMPLTWILKHPPAEWELGPGEDDRMLEVLVNKLPPHWRF